MRGSKLAELCIPSLLPLSLLHIQRFNVRPRLESQYLSHTHTHFHVIYAIYDLHGNNVILCLA